MMTTGTPEFDALPNLKPYRYLLKMIDDGLGTEECLKISFLLDMPKSKMEHVKRAIDIFEELETQLLVTFRDVSLLYEMMELIHRRDLLAKIEAYCRDASSKMDVVMRTNSSHFKKYRVLLVTIADNTSKSEMESFKHFCQDNLGRHAISQVKNVYQLFSLLEQRMLLTPSNVDFLLELLNCVGNRQMVEEVRKLNFAKNRIPTDVDLVELSSNLGSEWHALGTYLGIPYSMLQAIERDKRTTEERIKEMLFRWRERLSSRDDAFGILSNGLRSCHRVDLAEHVAQISRHAPMRDVTATHAISQPADSRLMTPNDFPPSPGTGPVRTSPDEERLRQLHGSPRQLDPPDLILRDLSEYLAADWQKIGTYLEIDYSTIPKIDLDGHNSNEKAFHMLMTWRSRLQPGSDGTHTLASVLKVVGRLDLSSKLKEWAKASKQNVQEQQSAPESMIVDPRTSVLQSGDDHRTPALPSGHYEQLVVSQPAMPPAIEPAKSIESTEQTGVKDSLGSCSPENLTVKSERMMMTEGVQAGARETVRQARVDHSETTRSTPGPIQEEHMDEYPMVRMPRGLCFIINNEHFTVRRFKDRPGSSIDSGKLQNLFDKLHFHVNVMEDLTASEMLARFKELSQMDHSEFDCFACCIMSHGKLGVIYGIDGKPIEIQEILGLFKAISCPSLGGKPKIFFIQACQGNEHQEGAPVETDEAPGMGSGIEKTLPKEADFLMSYATVPGYVSYRSPTSGSWYVTALVDLITQHHNELDLIRIMTRINNQLSEGTARMPIGDRKQIPAPSFTLRRDLYLRSLLD